MLRGGPCHGSYLGHDSSQNTRQSLSPLKLMPLEVSSWGGGHADVYVLLVFVCVVGCDVCCDACDRVQ